MQKTQKIKCIGCNHYFLENKAWCDQIEQGNLHDDHCEYCSVEHFFYYQVDYR